MRIFIAGGTGLLGAAGAKELISRGHSVCSVALPPIPEGADIPKEMELTFGNFMEMSDGELLSQMTGCDAFVFAAGVDERVEFPKPVYDSYYKYNIAPLSRMLAAAKKAGVKKAVVLGSYFSYFVKKWPKLKIYENHPYIRSRIDQEKEALSFNDAGFEVMILELPYIFGAQPGRKPVWMFFVDMLENMKTVYYPKGGTTMVTVRQVGEAIAGAIERGEGGTCYPVGMYNLYWTELISIINKYMGTPDKKIITIPTFLYKLNAKKMLRQQNAEGKESGLQPVEFVKIMTAETFIDGQLIKDKLGVSEDDIEKAIGESIKLCLEIKQKNKKVVTMEESVV